MLEQFYDRLGIPDACHLGKRIFKTMFYENAQLNVTDRKAFTEDIDEILWQYTLKPETINISRYEDEEREYHEIAIIQVTLRQPRRYKRIAEIIQRTIPYPILLVFTHGSHITLNVASKRINKADRDRMVVEQIQDTDWIDLNTVSETEEDFLESCNIRNLSFNDFRAFYQDIEGRITAYNCARMTGDFRIDSGDKTRVRREALGEIHALEQTQIELRAALKKESQFNRKVDLNVKLNSTQQQVETMKSRL
jgi:hypothetical protein